MNGFFASSNNHAEGSYKPGTFLSGARAMWYYDQRDIPFYYAVASTFSIGDRYFSPLIGPTFPNRDFLYAASSYGETGNDRFNMSGRGFPGHDVIIFDELEKRHTSWAVYKNGIAAGLESTLPVRDYYTRYGAWKHHQRFKGTDEFFEDAKSGSLPDVVFVDPNLLGGTPAAYHLPYDWENDEHPPSNLQKGQEFSAHVIHALTKSPQWKQLALFVTWDEAGGLYDHVAPPPACPPDDIEPALKTEANRAFPGRFDRYGFRVPVLVVSPFAKRSHVSHVVYDHTSILRFIEAKHKIPALSSRDANADPMFDMFDFDNPPFMNPPSLPDSYVDPVQHDACKRLYEDVK
jgi:phospholipase C